MKTRALLLLLLIVGVATAQTPIDPDKLFVDDNTLADDVSSSVVDNSLTRNRGASRLFAGQNSAGVQSDPIGSPPPPSAYQPQYYPQPHSVGGYYQQPQQYYGGGGAGHFSPSPFYSSSYDRVQRYPQYYNQWPNSLFSSVFGRVFGSGSYYPSQYQYSRPSYHPSYYQRRRPFHFNIPQRLRPLLKFTNLPTVNQPGGPPPPISTHHQMPPPHHLSGGHQQPPPANTFSHRPPPYQAPPPLATGQQHPGGGQPVHPQPNSLTPSGGAFPTHPASSGGVPNRGGGGATIDADPQPDRELTGTPPHLPPPQVADQDAKPTDAEETEPLIDYTCEENADDASCYHLVSDQALTLPDAIEYCERRGLKLARATDDNIDFLNQLIAERFSADESSCEDRLTMLANHETLRRAHAFTYAFTMGAGCGGPADDEESEHLYEICELRHECTRVDFLAPNAFVCVRPPEEGDGELCVKTLTKDEESGEELALTCGPITVDDPSALAYPLLCQPVEFGHFFQPAYQALFAKAQEELEREKIAFLSSTVVPQGDIGILKYCQPDCDDAEALANSYGVCRKIKLPAKTDEDDVPLPAQLWPHGSVPFAISDEFNDTQKAIFLEAVRIFNDESGACIRLIESNGERDMVRIFKSQSPNSCQSEAVGRAGTGEQAISYGAECFDKIGNVMRQLMHLFGVGTEHNRSDRDDYITVNVSNVYPQPEYRLLTVKQRVAGSVEQLPYDYASVTHYPTDGLAASADLVVFQARKNDPTTGEPVEIGQRLRLSDGDKAKLRLLYGACSATPDLE